MTDDEDSPELGFPEARPSHCGEATRRAVEAREARLADSKEAYNRDLAALIRSGRILRLCGSAELGAKLAEVSKDPSVLAVTYSDGTCVVWATRSQAHHWRADLDIMYVLVSGELVLEPDAKVVYRRELPVLNYPAIDCEVLK